ncbi:hypothetical protein BwSH20_11680 [Bradyrhizobium ottawaense]|nr:hypothetical protein SG09_57740 [Bradyrhizobium ottawaense]BBO12435.1 hypothetical protein TM102_39050 [Bradyrhizobium sp. TM102]GMO28630.1 hypothetical protein BwSF21_28730 [Bradyrhizobium ottawaense]GMO77089.1 hypothetical protein BwSH17_44870 [Bradyrhizobium ottawaense]GMO87404.1 hypothetical protein BwSF19_49780 [Bradyrhizobium ottawaense]
MRRGQAPGPRGAISAEQFKVIGKIMVRIHGRAYCVSEKADQPATRQPAGASDWDTVDFSATALVKQNDTV